jgi:proton-coupled amino acid transporter
LSFDFKVGIEPDSEQRGETSVA